jgi:parvulin-like peptidyl-prolyl isomerase
LSRSLLLAGLASLALVITGCGTPASAKPAIVVNSHQVSMAQYNQELRYECVNAVSSYGYDVCHDKSPSVFKTNLKQTVVQTLIDREIIEQYARAHNISVSQQAFQRYWLSVYKGKFNSKKVLNAFVARYGMTVVQFKARLRDDLLREDVAAQVARNAPTKVPAISVASLQVANSAANLQVAAELKQGKTFLSLVKQFDGGKTSACSSSSGCGYLGWVPIAFLPTYEKKLATAPVGEAVGPQHLQAGGYQWWLVANRKQNYALTAQQQITMRDQIIFPKWLAAQEKKASVKRYVAA